MTQKENKPTFADFATLTEAELLEISGGKRHWWELIVKPAYVSGGNLSLDVIKI